MGSVISGIGHLFGAGGSSGGSQTDKDKQMCDQAEDQFMLSQFEDRADQERKKEFAKDPGDQFY